MVEECDGYIVYIDEFYNVNCLMEILIEICFIIGVNILNIVCQDYEFQGVSVIILVSEEFVDFKLIDQIEYSGLLLEIVVVYFDKSYICVYIYLESYLEGGLCIFCVDIEVLMCGVIFLFKVLNYLIYQLELDIVIIDYCVCGFICDINGMKYFIDYEINLIQNFMFDDMKLLYDMVDVNVYQENIFYIKMLFKEFDFKYYMFYI